MKDAPDHKPDPKLVDMLVQHGDLPAFQIPELLERLAAEVYRRRPVVETEDPASDETEITTLRSQVEALRKELDEVPAKITELRNELVAKLEDLEAIDTAADKRVDAIDKAVAKLKAKATPKPAEEPATAA